MTAEFAVDTSVAVPLLMASHTAHAATSAWAGDRGLALGGHALAETFAVLTRLPGDARVSSADAARLIDERFVGGLAIGPAAGATVHRELARAGVVGGAVYDGLVALAAREHGLLLATRDARARATYEAVGVSVVVVPS